MHRDGGRAIGSAPYYIAEASGWISLYMDLGWIYPSISASNGIRYGRKPFGWVWTDSKLYPFLYSANSSGWVYFYGELDQRRLIYDYKRKVDADR